MLKTKTWILIFALLLLICAVSTLLLHQGAKEASVVEIRQGGRLIKTIDLTQVQNPYSFVVEDANGGSNTILVEPGRICISEADCPDQVCIRRGWLTDSAAPIVCLPHQLVIQAAEPGELDAVVQ